MGTKSDFKGGIEGEGREKREKKGVLTVRAERDYVSKRFYLVPLITGGGGEKEKEENEELIKVRRLGEERGEKRGITETIKGEGGGHMGGARRNYFTNN